MLGLFFRGLDRTLMTLIVMVYFVMLEASFFV
jgi:hypothetical protein